MRELPHGTVTFLFTDIEGSTRLLHDLGDDYAEALATHRRALREAFAARGGVEVDTQGDAFFYAFADAADAVAAAAAGRDALEGGPVLVRMGLHTGSPQVTEEGYVGLDVHLGARVAASGHGGQVLLTTATRELAEVEVLELGDHRLKDFADPVAIAQLGSRPFPPLKTISNTNLPRPASVFVGRERELAEVASLVRSARLVTLTGAGGSGKTRLALEAAAELVPEHRNGVFWVGLATLRDPALVPEAIAQSLGAKEELARYIGERELLLLLDNLEQVVNAAPELARLVELCPNLRLLVTSRELLRVRGEIEYSVPPLGEPDAVELFCRRSGVAAGADVEELCRRLDNLPLAIELAAARASVLSPRQLVERLGERLDLLRGGRDADRRQQTLRSTIAWSYDLLDDDEQRVFARLAVFVGGCTLTAAEAVCNTGLDTLQSLVDKSLVRWSDERFWMLETIREFAAERLRARAEFDVLVQRHAAWYAELVADLELRARHGDPEATHLLTDEIDNLRAGLEASAGRGDIGDAFWMLDGLWYFWIAKGHAAEGLRWARWAVGEAPNAPPEERDVGLLDASELFRFFGHQAEGLRIKRELLPRLREVSPTRHFPATLTDIADMLAEVGEFDEARQLAAQAVAIRRELGTRSGINHALVGLAMVEFRAGQFGTARELSEEALSLVEDPPVPTNARDTALLAGESARRCGDRSSARRLLLQALRLSAELGHRATFPELLQEIAAASTARADSVRLLSASEGLLREVGLPRWDPHDYERTIAELRATLGDTVFEEAWNNGATLSEKEVLSLAAGCLD